VKGEYSTKDFSPLEKLNINDSGRQDYDVVTLGEMLRDKSIFNKSPDNSKNLRMFNKTLKDKYQKFKENLKVDDTPENKYKKERCYSLLRDDKENFRGYFANQLVRLPASSESLEILTDYLDNIENPKNDIVQKKLLENLFHPRIFKIYKDCAVAS
jgi:hypothetical protein